MLWLAIIIKDFQAEIISCVCSNVRVFSHQISPEPILEKEKKASKTCFDVFLQGKKSISRKKLSCFSLASVAKTK